MRKSARAYTRVVLRLRAQVEAAARVRAKHGFVQSPVGEPGAGPPTAWAPNQGAPTAQARRQFSRSSSRAPSPTDTEDYAVSRTGHSRSRSRVSNRAPQSVAEKRTTGGAFRSPLFKPGRAALLRVFVPSREGSWLSDESVVRCEEELRKAAAGMRGMGLLKVGDVVWDVAVGEEGNVGRLVWDGAYLIDLDYTYSRTGDVPKYLHSLAFPPSYFHRVIRSAPAPTPAPPPSSSPGTHTDNSAGTANPIVHVDLRPWADEICGSVRLMQDRLRTEGRRTVVRWVHRARFHIRGGGEGGIPIPGTDAVVDRGWYGAVVVEAEGTNEGLAELRARCGVERHPRYGEAEWEERKVFRILRERSRPGEIWIRTVGEKERLM
ncbi:hypothetical protein PUNSTDRAFT_76010 [Punctularia strigosozonata HHB-11173 SS5]|uniref:Uncharacterized protein n=1 Tax=Punctularia strigosozonata (strain HHB-11173) TaxID=741275 RepID=R7S5N8_PUNST|nr:uncharacterized protein PUNSTDRAFT_76010 [Punctularia strigosozonata HHB-11173 SS5]EIN04791.1 hypothetical protein PUNSTDRAFT_76010 [Punctularia strigosozonata HHB-11173 SS5]